MEGLLLGGLLLVSIARLTLEVWLALREDEDAEAPGGDGGPLPRMEAAEAGPQEGEEGLWAHLAELLSYPADGKEGERK